MLFETSKNNLNETFIGLIANVGYQKDFTPKLFLQANIGVGNIGAKLFSKEESYNFYTGNIMMGYKF